MFGGKNEMIMIVFCNEGLWWRDRQLDTNSGRWQGFQAEADFGGRRQMRGKLCVGPESMGQTPGREEDRVLERWTFQGIREQRKCERDPEINAVTAHGTLSWLLRLFAVFQGDSRITFLLCQNVCNGSPLSPE